MLFDRNFFLFFFFFLIRSFNRLRFLENLLFHCGNFKGLGRNFLKKIEPNPNAASTHLNLSVVAEGNALQVNLISLNKTFCVPFRNRD